MADETDAGNGSIRRGSSGLVRSTVALQLVALAYCGVLALVAWSFGWLPNPSFIAAMTAMFAAKPAGDLYREGPPRRLAAAAALIALTTVALSVAATAEWASPVVADHNLGFLVGVLVGTPVGATVLAWFYNRANVA